MLHGRGLDNISGNVRVFWPDLFVRENDVNGIASFGTGTIQKHLNAGRAAMYKAGFSERQGRFLQVFSANQQVDVLSVADGRFVDANHPGGDGVATDDRVWHPSQFKGG